MCIRDRFGILIASPAGNDLLFDESSLEQGRNFNNKLWNALKLVKMWEGRQSEDADHSSSAFAMDWFASRLDEVKNEVEKLLKEFRLSEALKTLYSLIWDDFCSWYLEWVKPGFEQPIPTWVHRNTVHYFTQLLQMLHPFMPFITEEIYHRLDNHTDDLCVKFYSPAGNADATVLENGRMLKAVITGLRDLRNKNQVKPKEQITLHIQSAQQDNYKPILTILAKQVNAKEICFSDGPVLNSITTAIEKDKFYVETEAPLQTGNQKDSLMKDLEHQNCLLYTSRCV